MIGCPGAYLAGRDHDARFDVDFLIGFESQVGTICGLISRDIQYVVGIDQDGASRSVRCRCFENSAVQADICPAELDKPAVTRNIAAPGINDGTTFKSRAVVRIYNDATAIGVFSPTFRGNKGPVLKRDVASRVNVNIVGVEIVRAVRRNSPAVFKVLCRDYFDGAIFIN